MSNSPAPLIPRLTPPRSIPAGPSKLMVGVSGIRGIIGESLTPHVIERWVSAFAYKVRTEWFCGKDIIVLGQDSRVSGPWIVKMIQGILCAHGFTVQNVGIVPTPTVQYMVMHAGAAAGIVVTSSHNPVPWNGIKFVEASGLFLSPEHWKELEFVTPSIIEYPDFASSGRVVEVSNAIEVHLDKIFSIPEIRPEAVRERHFRVCLDTVNGGPIMTQLLERLGCEVIPLNTEPTGLFAHTPEPIPANLEDLCTLVKDKDAHLGIAVDPDGDRFVMIDNTGEPVGEEYTLAMAVQFWLGTCGKRGAVVKNLSTTRAIDDICEEYGCPVVATAIGEINVAMEMVSKNAVIGGEGNGGVMLPDVHIGRDAPVACALILQLLASWKGSVRELREALPNYYMSKLKTTLDDVFLAATSDKWRARGATVTTIDGVHISTPRWWVQIRKSNTEPIVRVFAEAPEKEDAEHVAQQFMEALQSGGLFSPRI